MKIEWNKVTWYSKIIALVLFVSLPFTGFYLGFQYGQNIGQKETSTNETTIKNNSSNHLTATSSTNTNQKSYPNPCASGEVALYEGGIFAGCAKPNQ